MILLYMLTGKLGNHAGPLRCDLLLNYVFFRTPFGHEYEATAFTKYNIHKAEDILNHFMVVTGTYLEELISKMEEEFASKMEEK